MRQTTKSQRGVWLHRAWKEYLADAPEGTARISKETLSAGAAIAVTRIVSGDATTAFAATDGGYGEAFVYVPVLDGQRTLFWYSASPDRRTPHEWAYGMVLPSRDVQLHGARERLSRVLGPKADYRIVEPGPAKALWVLGRAKEREYACVVWVYPERSVKMGQVVTGAEFLTMWRAGAR